MVTPFDAFWAQFPRRIAKLDAQRAYLKALKLAPAEDILAGAIRYATQVKGKDPQFTKYPAGWLRGGGWMDETPAPQLTGTDALRDRLRREIEDGQISGFSSEGDSAARPLRRLPYGPH